MLIGDPENRLDICERRVFSHLINLQGFVHSFNLIVAFFSLYHSHAHSFRLHLLLKTIHYVLMD